VRVGKHLPPLGTLVFFEAAARLESLTLAADELFITQSAVSKQIKKLEASLGFQLFRREPRKLVLTEEGTVFLADVTYVLGHLSGSVEKLRRKPDSNAVTITCTQAVSHYWLFPRIVQFNQDEPDIPVNVYATNHITEASTFQFDFGILNGTPELAQRFEAHVLFPERVFAVCSDTYRLKAPLTPKELLSESLVHLDPSAWHWPTWIDWFASSGLKYQIPTNAPRYNQIMLALEATSRGLGVGLGWEFMIGRHINDQSLRYASDHVYEPDLADYLVSPKNARLSDAAMTFRDWLIESASQK